MTETLSQLEKERVQVVRDIGKRPKLTVLTSEGGDGCPLIGFVDTQGALNSYFGSELWSAPGGTTFQGSNSAMRLIGWSGRRESTSRR